jgi:hypothetical protein
MVAASPTSDDVDKARDQSFARAVIEGNGELIAVDVRDRAFAEFVVSYARAVFKTRSFCSG